MASIIILLMASVASANHGHHHGHSGAHHTHGPISQSSPPVVSSFSHVLPGTNSYMSVTRYFNTHGTAHEHETTLSEHNHSTEDNFHPWNPRFQVSRIEVDDEEWAEQLQEVFEESGLLGSDLVPEVPKGLVNLNYDIHVCVHMGTEITPQESAYPPTAISYPTSSPDTLHTLIMLDTSLNKLHWMITDIPGSKVHEGKVVSAYAGPNPGQNTGIHKYALLVMEQKNPVPDEILEGFKTETSCQTLEIPSLNFPAIQTNLNLSNPVAANFFTQKFDPFVEDINGHCLPHTPIQPHPLYR